MKPNAEIPMHGKPINFALKEKPFKEGVLCFALIRRYKGRGPKRLLLHEATVGLSDGRPAFMYGADRCWIVNPASLMGANRTRLKTLAARINGKKGGRPKSK